MTNRRRFLLLNQILLSRYAPVGGQAVIEGVMMRSPTWVATAVQRSSGEIVLHKTPFESVTRRLRVLGLPVVRGAVGLGETLMLGMQCLSFSAAEAAKDEGGKAGEDSRGFSNWSLGLTVGLSMLLGLVLFFYLPLKLTEWLGVDGRIRFNLVDGAIRLTFFLAYLWGVSQWREMRRLFEYHGAEHKSIHAFEAGLDVSAANARPFSTLHPRCGTSFLLSFMLLSVVVFMFFGRPHTVGERLLRLAGIPLIAGLGFEYIRWSGRHAQNRLVALLALPGLGLQTITTKEPSDAQLAVACRALAAVLPLSDEDRRGVRVM